MSSLYSVKKKDRKGGKKAHKIIKIIPTFTAYSNVNSTSRDSFVCKHCLGNRNGRASYWLLID